MSSTWLSRWGGGGGGGVPSEVYWRIGQSGDVTSEWLIAARTRSRRSSVTLKYTHADARPSMSLSHSYISSFSPPGRLSQWRRCFLIQNLFHFDIIISYELRSNITIIDGLDHKSNPGLSALPTGTNGLEDKFHQSPSEARV